MRQLCRTHHNIVSGKFGDGCARNARSAPQLTAVLVKAVQEQQAEIDNLKRIVERLSNQ
jgi:hypothetical protein